MEKNQRRILLFDIDGTLMDSAGEGPTCFRRALEDVYGVSGPVDAFDMGGKTDWQIITDLQRMAGLSLENIEAHREEAFAAYTRHVERAARTLKMRALPGVMDLLTRLLDDPQFILSLVTGNVREAVPHKLRAVGLDPGIFISGAFGSEHHDRNTLPELALRRLEKMIGAPILPQAALVIGDTPRDIDCARHAGMKVLCVATGRFDRKTLDKHHPDYLLDDLTNVEEVLHIFKTF